MVCMTLSLSITAFADETATANQRSNEGSYNYSHRVVGRAYNDAPGGAVAVTVVSNVDTTSGIRYYWDGKSCYASATYSKLDYGIGVYNPEICTYSCGVGSQNVTQNGVTKTYRTSDMTEEYLWLPSDRWGEMYVYSYDSADGLINFPIKVKSNFVFTWSSNVVPAASSFSTTFTLTSP